MTQLNGTLLEGRETKDGQGFVVEASDLGWEAGLGFPDVFEVKGENGWEMFEKKKVDKSRDGEVLDVIYGSVVSGLRLVVLND